MYITVEAFMKCVPHYLQLAKSMDVHIEDTTQMTVWVLHCQRTPLLARLTNTLRELSRNHTNPAKEWKTLPSAISVKDEWVNEPKFTSLFLLEHSQQSFELFNIRSEEEYRLMIEINKAFNNLSASTSEDSTAVYRVNDTHSVIVDESFFAITNNNGDIIERVAISSFAKSPRASFNKIKKLVE